VLESHHRECPGEGSGEPDQRDRPLRVSGSLTAKVDLSMRDGGNRFWGWFLGLVSGVGGRDVEMAGGEQAGPSADSGGLDVHPLLYYHMVV
jgi:hypothetical protein